MTTLTTAPVPALLERLFAQAEAASPHSSRALQALPETERTRLMRSKTEYLDFYTRMKDLPLPVSRQTGALLYMLARGCRARAIVEFGMSFAISTIHLAAALRDNGGGLLITTEFEPGKVARGRENLRAAALEDLVEIRPGDALQTLAGELPDVVDLLLLDGAKALYPEVLRLVHGHLKAGAFVVADNADYCPEYLAWVRDPANGYLSVPFAEDVELSMRAC